MDAVRTAVMSQPAPRTTPWHRQRWPWFLMLGPAIAVVASFLSLWYAATTEDGLVADDYYKRGLAINHKLERVDRAAALGVGATVSVDDAGNARVALSASDPAILPVSVRLSVLHPTREGFDHRGVLFRGPDGDYVGRLEPIAPGRWLLTVETDDWRLPVVETSGAVRAVHLAAGAQ